MSSLLWRPWPCVPPPVFKVSLSLSGLAVVSPSVLQAGGTFARWQHQTPRPARASAAAAFAPFARRRLSRLDSDAIDMVSHAGSGRGSSSSSSSRLYVGDASAVVSASTARARDRRPLQFGEDEVVSNRKWFAPVSEIAPGASAYFCRSFELGGLASANVTYCVAGGGYTAPPPETGRTSVHRVLRYRAAAAAVSNRRRRLSCCRRAVGRSNDGGYVGRLAYGEFAPSSVHRLSEQRGRVQKLPVNNGRCTASAAHTTHTSLCFIRGNFLVVETRRRRPSIRSHACSWISPHLRPALSGFGSSRCIVACARVASTSYLHLCNDAFDWLSLYACGSPTWACVWAPSSALRFTFMSRLRCAAAHSSRK